MKITERKLAELIPYERNAKQHDQTQIANVAKSIDKYGFVQPIVIDKDNVIVIGHCRALAAKKLGLETVPTVSVENLSEDEVNALRIVDNKANESEWDTECLLEELAGIDLNDFDFDFSELLSDAYGENFELPSGEKDNYCQMTFTLATEQAEEIKAALKEVDAEETFGNENRNGNALYEIVRQWAQKNL